MFGLNLGARAREMSLPKKISDLKKKSKDKNEMERQALVKSTSRLVGQRRAIRPCLRDPNSSQIYSM
ncbi:Uncharacterized protein APZ42_029685 [Daphnia magna]|uniref:Uncharacterized protein n=1 Tax=Daphnia magna TaxID=35525 RepID=A0A164PEI6_9CRUS|nr:Uncharacterized protein APZ42_029685 [Daphnia magna]